MLPRALWHQPQPLCVDAAGSHGHESMRAWPGSSHVGNAGTMLRICVWCHYAADLDLDSRRHAAYLCVVLCCCGFPAWPGMGGRRRAAAGLPVARQCMQLTQQSQRETVRRDTHTAGAETVSLSIIEQSLHHPHMRHAVASCLDRCDSATRKTSAPPRQDLTTRHETRGPSPYCA